MKRTKSMGEAMTEISNSDEDLLKAAESIVLGRGSGYADLETARLAQAIGMLLIVIERRLR